MADFEACDFTSPLVRLAPLHHIPGRRRALCLVSKSVRGGRENSCHQSMEVFCMQARSPHGFKTVIKLVDGLMRYRIEVA